MAMLGLDTSELPSTPSLPQTTTLPSVASASLDELTTIGPDFRLTTGATDIENGATDEANYVTEQSKEKEATTGTPTFFTAESQPSTSPGLSTLPDEGDSVVEHRSSTDSSQASPGYELETQTLDERSEDKAGGKETATERAIQAEDSLMKEDPDESSVREDFETNDPATEGSITTSIVEDASSGSSENKFNPERSSSEKSPSSEFTTESTKPSGDPTVEFTVGGATPKEMNNAMTTAGLGIEVTTRKESITSPRVQAESNKILESTTESAKTDQTSTVQASTEGLSIATIGMEATTREENSTDPSRKTESIDFSNDFTTESSRPLAEGSKDNSDAPMDGFGVIATEASGTSGESIPSRSSQTESDVSGESASARPNPSSSTASEKIGIIHETEISDTSTPTLSVEDLATILKNSTLAFNPEDIDFGGLSEEFGNDTLFIIEDILVDSDGRVINSTATTNLADNILPNALDPNLLNTLGNVPDRQNNQDQNSQTVNADERDKGKAKEEGDQIAGSDHEGNSGTDKGEVEIDDDAEPSQSSIRPEIDASVAEIPPNLATGTENPPADLSGQTKLNKGDNNEDDLSSNGIIVPTASSEDHAPNIVDPDNNLSGASGEPGVIRERDDPGAGGEADGPTAQTTARQESDGPTEKGGEKISNNQEGVADQQKNQEDAGDYPNDQVTSTSVPSDYTLNDGSDETTTESSTHSQTTNPATPLSRKVEDGNQLEESFPSMIPGLEEEDVEFEDQEEECFRRYTEARRSVDISYYNTTVRTRLLTAICLEGIRCEPGQDATRCQFLHSKCNQQVDTSKLSFGMRVTLSECTVEDVLCHLGHRTPVMCCQDR